MKAKLLELIFILLCGSGALAYCPVPEIKANGEYFKSDLVFTGKVLSERYQESEDTGGWFYTLSVKQVFKGPRQQEFTVYTENASARFPLEVGGEYLLFAYRSQNRLEIYDCGNSAPLSKATTSIERIRSIANTPDGEVEGWVVGETGGVDCSGIYVLIRGQSQTYRAVTDQDGYFHFRAPKGRYRVDFSNGEYFVNADDFFWYKPKGFTLHTGESAALKLVSVRQPKK